MMPPARQIVSHESHPDNPKRWLYTLSCGHVVSRRGNSRKTHCLCGLCAELQVETIATDTSHANAAWDQVLRDALAIAANQQQREIAA